MFQGGGARSVFQAHRTTAQTIKHAEKLGVNDGELT